MRGAPFTREFTIRLPGNMATGNAEIHNERAERCDDAHLVAGLSFILARIQTGNTRRRTRQSGGFAR